MVKIIKNYMGIKMDLEAQMNTVHLLIFNIN